MVEPPSTTRAVLDVDGGGAQDRSDVDAGVRVEPSVLDRNDGVARVLRHLILGQDDAILGGVQLRDPGAIGRVHERRLGKRTLPLVLQAG